MKNLLIFLSLLPILSFGQITTKDKEVYQIRRTWTYTTPTYRVWNHTTDSGTIVIDKHSINLYLYTKEGKSEPSVYKIRSKREFVKTIRKVPTWMTIYTVDEGTIIRRIATDDPDQLWTDFRLDFRKKVNSTETLRLDATLRTSKNYPN